MEDNQSFRQKTTRSICRSLRTSSGISLSTYRHSNEEVYLEIKSPNGSSWALGPDEVLDLYELLKLSIDEVDEA